MLLATLTAAAASFRPSSAGSTLLKQLHMRHKDGIAVGSLCIPVLCATILVGDPNNGMLIVVVLIVSLKKSKGLRMSEASQASQFLRIDGLKNLFFLRIADVCARAFWLAATCTLLTTLRVLTPGSAPLARSVRGMPPTSSTDAAIASTAAWAVILAFSIGVLGVGASCSLKMYCCFVAFLMHVYFSLKARFPRFSLLLPWMASPCYCNLYSASLLVSFALLVKA